MLNGLKKCRSAAFLLGKRIYVGTLNHVDSCLHNCLTLQYLVGLQLMHKPLFLMSGMFFFKIKILEMLIVIQN